MNEIFHEFFIYNEYGILIYYTDFLTSNNNFITRMEDEKDFRNRIKTIFGVVKTLCDIVNRISERISTNNSLTPFFKEFITNCYKMSCYKSVTNKFFVLSTKIDRFDYSGILKQIYQNIFIEYILKNPLYVKDNQIDIPVFNKVLLEFFLKLFKAMQGN